MRWQDHAACRGLGPEMFYPHHGENKKSQQARLVCLGCPVKRECLDFALTNEHDDGGGSAVGERYGVWGGLSLNERRGMMPVRKPELAARNRAWRDVS